jgi:hypothetical protein
LLCGSKLEKSVEISQVIFIGIFIFSLLLCFTLIYARIKLYNANSFQNIEVFKIHENRKFRRVKNNMYKHFYHLQRPPRRTFIRSEDESGSYTLQLLLLLGVETFDKLLVRLRKVSSWLIIRNGLDQLSASTLSSRLFRGL